MRWHGPARPDGPLTDRENGTRVAAWSDDTGVHSQLVDAQGGLVGSAVSFAASGTFTGVAPLDAFALSDSAQRE